ncbi:MAG: universal stress protein [Propionicimonas sp.]|uniref:universal stress protein n=1 Tax=Propionicimonas sp. TaxID=1955623 RepID=UPI003D0C5604
MKVLVWVAEATWPACVDAVLDLFPAAGVTLLAALPGDLAAQAAGARTGLWGRGSGRDPGARVTELARESTRAMLDAAVARLGREAATVLREGRVEREVTAAATEADVLVLARDGDLSRLGPHSLDRHTRFVVDHAPCRVLLVWPGRAPGLASIPPPPPER